MIDVEQRADPARDPNLAPARVFPVVPRWGAIAIAILAQVIVSLAIGEVPLFGLVHAAGLFAVGMYAALRRDLTLVLCCAAYLTGSEVMWRQASAPIPYLAAPYLLIMLSVFAVVFGIGRLGRNARLAVLYAALLLPAAISTIRTAGDNSRELIAFALSGPLAMAAFIAFTSQVRVAPWLYRRVLWVTLVSAFGPLTIAVSRLRADYLASGGIEFSEQSNFAASGGFGPVQVSSVLSLGILAAVLLLLSEPSRAARILAAVAGFAMLVQTLLTFSRGGSFSIALAVVALALVSVSDRRVRRRIFAISAVTLTLAYFLVFPWLETFTGGAFEERFSDQTSSRTDLAANDVEIFARSPLLGVGPGMTKFQRLGYEVCQLRSDNCRDEASSHTEFTRMLGEHGVPGVIALVVLATLAMNAFRARGPGWEFSVAFLVWAIAQMFYANLRITAVPFAFGLAFLRLTSATAPSDDDDPAAAPIGGPYNGHRANGTPTELTAAHTTGRTNGDHPEVPGGAREGRPVGFGAGYGAGGRIERRVGFGGPGTTAPAPGSNGTVRSNGSPATNGTTIFTNPGPRTNGSHDNGGRLPLEPPPFVAPTDEPG